MVRASCFCLNHKQANLLNVILNKPLSEIAKTGKFFLKRYLTNPTLFDGCNMNYPFQGYFFVIKKILFKKEIVLT